MASPAPLVRVQHHPSRASLLPRLLERLGELPVEIVPDPRPDVAIRSALRTYAACLEPDPAGRHLIVLQDDAIPCPGFDVAAPVAIAARPGDVVGFYLGGLPALTGNDYERARKAGARFALHNQRDWCPAVALAWPPDRAAEMAEFIAARRWAQAADDSVIGMWARRSFARVWHTIPSLVQHPDDVPQVNGSRPARRGADRGRVARYYTGEDAATIDWG